MGDGGIIMGEIRGSEDNILSYVRVTIDGVWTGYGIY
jgi:hypothetical protein